jgi:hypothetical protein
MKTLKTTNLLGGVSKPAFLSACALSVAMALTGCNSNTTPTSNYTGTVSAPGGSVAFNPPTGLKKMFAEMVGGKMAEAAISGVSSVGAGVTIELIEVDADGNKVGDTIASTTTASDGSYTLVVPTDYTPSSKYVIRATGTTETLDTRVTSTTNDVDPITDAASDLITTEFTDLSKISVDEVEIINDAVESVAQDVDTSGLTADELSTALQTEATGSEEVINQITSTSATGEICGNVKDASNNNLENILIIVRDFGDWVTRAKIKTDSNGDYCVNVPDGNYILGALNFTTTSMGASEWWHSSGTKYAQIDADKITVAANTVTKNFQLEDGARLKGTITAGSGGSLAAGTALENVKVQIRNYQNFFPVAGKKTNASGKYVINVIPGTYLVGAINRTLNPYASEYYTSGGGVNMYYEADSVSLTAGNTTTMNFELAKGYKLAGTILDAAGGNPVTGMRIRVNKLGSGPVVRIRSNKNGKYRIWLPADTYFAESYGQSISSIDMTSSNATWSPVGPVTAISTNVTYNGSGVSQAKAWLMDSSNNTISQEVSSGDGSITLYCKTCGTDYKVYVRIDESRDWATTAYSGKTDISTNYTLVDATQTTLPDIALLAGGTLTVNVTSDGTTAEKNFKTRVLSGSSGSDFLVNVQRTHGDGSYVISLPAGSWRIKMLSDSTHSKPNCPVTITAGGSTTLNYNSGTGACS